MKIVIAGGTGFIGRALTKKLVEDKHSVVLLTRDVEAVRRRVGSAADVERWDGRAAGGWSKKVDGADAVLNFAGEPIAARRWTAARKERIIRSRIDPTRCLLSAIRGSQKKPSVLINASAVGYYGAMQEGDVAETHKGGKGFLPTLCTQWEDEARVAEGLGVRVAMLRTGIVLGEGGGALEKMLLPFKMFAGGPIGTGEQWFPWVHLDDVVDAVRFALTSSAVSGPVNIAAPEPVTMKEFCSALGSVMHRPSWVPVPGFVLKLMLGEMSEMLLTGQRVVPEKLKALGYTFRFPRLIPALEEILAKNW